MVGLTLGSSIGPSVLLYGLAAAVVARMDSLPLCIVAGMGIGIVDQSALYGTRKASLSVAIMLVVILAALLAQRARLARAFDTAIGTWQSVKEYRPIPSELRDTTEVGYAKSVLAALVLFVTVTLPLLLPDRFAGRFTLVVIVAIVGVSLVILTGWSGQISLGQFGFAGVGALVAGALSTNFDADFFVCVLAAGIAGAITAVVIGLPALRIQGLFLAVTTLAFAFTVQYFLLNRDYFGWALPEQGEVVGRPRLYGRFDVSSDTRFYFVCLFFLALSLLAARSLRQNRSGRIMIGVRDNGRGVQAYGVNLARTRLAAFAISGFIAAIAGALLAFNTGSVDATTFSPERSISVFTIAVIGGLTSLPGAMLGAIWVEGVPFLFSGSEFVRLLTSGVGLLVLLLLVPGGLSEIMYRLRDTYLRWVAARNGIHVPSLVSDSLVTDDTGALTEAARGPEERTLDEDEEKRVLVAKVEALESRLADLERSGAVTSGGDR
jgi:branched-chain amino acid transport system permease protein